MKPLLRPQKQTHHESCCLPLCHCHFHQTNKLVLLLLRLLLHFLRSMNLFETVWWFTTVISGTRSRRRHGSHPRRAGRHIRRPPPDVRIDLSDGRHPLTRPTSPRPEAQTARGSRSLLDALPLELRQLIWAELLGGHVFHVEIREGVLTGQVCLIPRGKACSRGHFACSLPLPDERSKTITRQKLFLFPILLSCKQMLV
jgi:hypothetical protein